MALLIRPGQVEDIDQINQILNHYITNTAIIFDIEAWSFDQRQQWFKQYNSDLYHLLVAVDQDEMIGLVYNSGFMNKPAYNISSEVSVYLNSKHNTVGQGIASRLYTTLFDMIDQSQIHRLYARITLPNLASINLHQKFGFLKVGTLDETGYKFGSYHSVDIYQKKLN
jgi:phosphinothricin acetyltransferase